jgi:hypothetical protein
MRKEKVRLTLDSIEELLDLGEKLGIYRKGDRDEMRELCSLEFEVIIK